MSTGMRRQIEQWEAERAAAVRQTGIEIGDFVNLTRWFGDVWAEVVAVHLYDAEDMQRFSGVTFVCYSKDGMMRGLEDSYLGGIRKITKAAEASSLRGIVYSAAAKIDFFKRVEWPTPAERNTPPRGNGADHRQEKHPDFGVPRVAASGQSPQPSVDRYVQATHLEVGGRF